MAIRDGARRCEMGRLSRNASEIYELPLELAPVESFGLRSAVAADRDALHLA